MSDNPIGVRRRRVLDAVRWMPNRRSATRVAPSAVTMAVTKARHRGDDVRLDRGEVAAVRRARIVPDRRSGERRSGRRRIGGMRRVIARLVRLSHGAGGAGGGDGGARLANLPRRALQLDRVGRRRILRAAATSRPDGTRERTTRGGGRGRGRRSVGRAGTGDRAGGGGGLVQRRTPPRRAHRGRARGVRDDVGRLDHHDRANRVRVVASARLVVVVIPGEAHPQIARAAGAMGRDRRGRRPRTDRGGGRRASVRDRWGRARGVGGVVDAGAAGEASHRAREGGARARYGSPRER